ncbi:MAG: asparaginase [Candidatus Eisenbacteria bacterium]|nr:asparaginase [Candidatus Eisenbacteria bacterium]
MNHQAYAPMVEVTRGVSVESAHRGAIAAVDMNGRLIASIGTPAHPVFVRSCAKPFQALALVCSGAADAFGVTEEELAVVCASHSGEPEHVRLVTSLLQKAGISPRSSEVRGASALRQQRPSCPSRSGGRAERAPQQLLREACRDAGHRATSRPAARRLH